MRHRIPPTLLGIALFALASSCTDTDSDGEGAAGPECSAQKACQGGQVCLEIGSCADPCATNEQCGGGEKCSAGGGCVAESGCGANGDCTGGDVCGTAGVCEEPCTPTSCPIGQSCTASGRCVLPGTGPAASSCGGELFGVTPVQANFYVVLDHSGSMQEEVGGAQKWTSAVGALREITQTHDATIRFGLQLFSTAQQQCDPGQQVVAIGDNQAAAISAALPATADGNRTPIGAALQVASQNPGLTDAQRSNNVLLITDGMENCNGDPVAQTSALLARGIKTYVLGFGDEVDADMLSDMATSGGTARAGAVKYYQADDPTALYAAMQTIAKGALGCDIALTQRPPDPSKIFIYVNGSEQPRDASRQNGWDYLASSNRITLYGASCSQVSANPNAKVQVVYGCPDGFIVEGGPGSSCTTPSQCASGVCTNGTCQAPTDKPDGAPCVSSSECASGTCDQGLCEGGPSGNAPGEACTTNSECESQVCFGGVCSSGIG